MRDGWRSLLFVPADATRLLAKADQREADAVILDLEDGVSPTAKPAARLRIAEESSRLAGKGVPVVVRVNASWLDLIEDLRAAVGPSVRAIMLPKVEDAGQVRAVAALIGELELRAGVPQGATRLLPLIETPAGLAEVGTLAATPRVIGLAFGGEDFSRALGVPPAPATLGLPCQSVALAARARGLMALGLPGSLADFQDLEAYAAIVTAGRALGMTGALCIHPAQVPIVNAGFGPTPEEIIWAHRVLDLWADVERTGSGVGSLEGRMIDKPVVDRARAILALNAPME